MPFYTDCTDRSHLRLTGRDRQSFLQGQITNDVAALTPGQGCYAFQLTATGQVLSDMLVLCLSDALLLDMEPGMSAVVAENLEKYLIMERCKVQEYAVNTYFIGGEGITEYITATFGIPDVAEWAEGRCQSVGDAVLARVHWTKAPGFALFSNDGPPELPSRPAEYLNALRIEAGIPKYGVDIEAKVLAPETNQQHRAIHYRKGCYIGQEIVARIDARGHTNRGLVGFHLTQLVPHNTPVLVDGKEVGRITSSCIAPTGGTPIGIGYVRHEHAAVGTVVEIAGEAGSVAALPF